MGGADTTRISTTSTLKADALSRATGPPAGNAAASGASLTVCMALRRKVEAHQQEANGLRNGGAGGSLLLTSEQRIEQNLNSNRCGCVGCCAVAATRGVGLLSM